MSGTAPQSLPTAVDAQAKKPIHAHDPERVIKCKLHSMSPTGNPDTLNRRERGGQEEGGAYIPTSKKSNNKL